MTLYGTPRPATHRPPRRAPWLTLAAAALTLTLVASLGWIAYTTHTDRARLDNGQTALTRAWSLQIAQADVPAAVPEAGGPIGRMFIPHLGLNWILVEGVTDAALAAGPGHYPGTARPGQVGNMAVAGHREAGMWADLDRMAAGDAVVVETRSRWYVYRVLSNRVVDPTDLAEVAPVPPGATRGSRLLTLTTCWPRFGNSRRIAVRAVLERTSPADQPPEELR